MTAFETSVRIARPIEEVFASAIIEPDEIERYPYRPSRVVDSVAALLGEPVPLRAEGERGRAEVIDLEAKER